MSIIETLVEKFPIRKSAKQKEAFRAWFAEWAKAQGYTARVESGGNLFKCHNVIAGDPEKAEVVFTAHYDTPAVMPLPNFITPCNVLVYLVYQVVMSLLILAPGILLGALAGWLGGYIGPDAGFLIGDFATMVLVMVTLLLMLAGPANKSNVNDNTSGVAAVMEIMARLDPALREKAAFILFDNEEKGMLGSGAYVSKHKTVKKEKLLINLDCVGDGENVLFFVNKRTRKLPAYGKLESALKAQTGRTLVMNRMEKCVYPSDQASFRFGVAVCACNRRRYVGYCCDKIHTAKDTVCEQVNLDFLAAGLTAFVGEL